MWHCAAPTPHSKQLNRPDCPARCGCIRLPSKDRDGVAENKRDWPTRHDAISVNPDTGAITDRVNFADWPFLAKLTDWAIDAHMGVLFGLVNQIVLALTAIGLILIVLRGYLMWWQRRPTRGSRWVVGRPPLCGVLRNLSPAALAGLGIVALAVGWFLPLFGLSLLAFLLVDITVGAIKRRTVSTPITGKTN